MLKTSIIPAIVLVVFLFSCKSTVPVVNGKAGCWFEKEVYREVCGTAEEYRGKDSTYIMRTYDGWAMRVKASAISWKQ